MITARQTARVFGLSMVQVKTCAQCGKRFSIVSPDYAYKLEGGKGAKRQAWFCSYGCMRIVQKPLEEARKAEFEERVFRDVFGLDEGEKHNQRTLAAYHAKKQAEDAAMTEKEREDKAARLAEAKRLAGQASPAERAGKKLRAKGWNGRLNATGKRFGRRLTACRRPIPLKWTRRA